MGYYSFNRPRRDGRLSWPCWLTDSGRITHKVVTRPAIRLAQDRESSPAKDRRSYHYAMPPTTDASDFNYANLARARFGGICILNSRQRWDRIR